MTLLSLVDRLKSKHGMSNPQVREGRRLKKFLINLIEQRRKESIEKKKQETTGQNAQTIFLCFSSLSTIINPGNNRKSNEGEF